MGGPAVAGFVRSAFRLLTVQACFNYERMLGVGLAYATEPMLRALPGGRGGAPYRDALRRSAGYFNAHPYLVGLAAGALARAEFDGVPGTQIDRLRTALLGPLGAIGDRLVWAGTLPAASAVGLALAADARAGVGAAALLALYNVPHLVLRVWGLVAGWRNGVGVARALGAPVLVWALRVVGPVASLAVGFAMPLVLARLVGRADLAVWAGAAVGAVGGLIVMRWIAPSLGPVRLALGAAVAVILGAAW